MSTRRRTAAALSYPLTAAVIAILLCGCTTPVDVRDPQTASPEPTPSSEPASSPLDPYIDILYAQQSDDEYRENFRQQEESIATCMAAAGFDYTPRPEAFVDADIALNSGSPESREWVAQNGYGIHASKSEEFAALEAADPNARMVAGFSESEQREYYLALWGNQNTVGSAEGTTGCSGSAETDEPPLSLSERYAPLIESLNRLYGETIPRLADAIAVDSAWSECMSGAGHPGLPNPAAAIERAGQIDESEQAGAFLEGDAAKLAIEVDIALADFDCAIETDYAQRMRAVTVAAETQFVEQNTRQLDPLLAEVAQGSGR